MSSLKKKEPKKAEGAENDGLTTAPKDHYIGQDKYKGTLDRQGRPEGSGTMIFANNDKYSGGFKAGLKHGFGKRENVDMSSYEGEYFNGKPNGKGIFIWADGDKYDGMWRHGVFHGQGKKESKDGTTYDGEWRDGLPHGKGDLKWSDGSRYDGQWRDGQPNGEGTKYHTDGSQYHGSWVDGEATGHGMKENFISKCIFTGEWVRNELVYGKCEYPNQSEYEGQWMNGKPHGKGKMVWPNDDKMYEGEYFAGKPCGRGVKTESDGTQISGYWAGGKFFDGEPPEGALEKQYENLSFAQKVYSEANKKLEDNEGISDPVLGGKQARSRKFKGGKTEVPDGAWEKHQQESKTYKFKEEKTKVNVWKDKKNEDRSNDRGSSHPVTSFRPQGENEMDLIKEQSKKMRGRNKANEMQVPIKYYID